MAIERGLSAGGGAGARRNVGSTRIGRLVGAAVVALLSTVAASCASGGGTDVAAIGDTTASEQAVTVTGIVDGDTIETSAGTVRLIGIDTAEEGHWGHAEASAELNLLIQGQPTTLVAVDGRADVDQYGRLLRYLRVNGTDAGSRLISTGWAVARYDSRDGYGSHPLEADYVALDAAHEMPPEQPPVPAPAEPVPPAEPAAPPVPAAPAQPAPPAAPVATDPQFGTCGAANDAGYGDYQRGVHPEYAWYQDRDGDGVVCER